MPAIVPAPTTPTAPAAAAAAAAPTAGPAAIRPNAMRATSPPRRSRPTGPPGRGFRWPAHGQSADEGACRAGDAAARSADGAGAFELHRLPGGRERDRYGRE